MSTAGDNKLSAEECRKKLKPFVLSPRKIQFNSKEEKGCGAYGTVFEVTVSGVPCVAKRVHETLVDRLRVSSRERNSVTEQFLRECVLLSGLDHPNVVRFVGVHYGNTPHDVSLVMERMSTDLGKYVENTPNVPLSTKLSILYDVSNGLLYLHDKNILHRDLTANNVLLTENLRAKIADLGVSKLISVQQHMALAQTKAPGSLNYMPPEALKENPKYDQKIDIFSFGHLAIYVVIQEFPNVYEVTITPAVQGIHQRLRRQKSLDKVGEDHCLHALITRCLSDAPEKRPLTEDVNAQMKLQLALHKQEQTEAKMIEKDLTVDRLERSLNSLQDKLKVTTMENVTLKDRLRKVGFLQEESDGLTTALNQKTKELEEVVAERDQLKNSLQLTQTQVSIYEEDFKTERYDRARAQTQRAEEGERYREEIARLQKELNSYKGNLSGVEQIHIARQKELIKAMEDLKKAQEEIQAKTSQVKQYKKQHDQLVAKVFSLESDNRGLTEQFEVVRQKLEKIPRKLPDGHAEQEPSHVQEQLTKQIEMTEKYKRKSKARKSQIADLASRYTSDMEQLRKDSKSKEKKKSVNKVGISSPVSDMEQHCRVLEYTNESLQEENKVLKEINETLRGLLRQSSDTDNDDDDDVSSANTKLSRIEAMHKPPPHSAAVPPEESVPLPPPIVNYSMDEPKMAGVRKGTQQPNFHGYVDSGQTVQPSHVQRRQLSDTNAGGMEVEHGPVVVPPQSVTQMMQATVLSTEHSKHQPEQPQPHPPDLIVKNVRNDNPQYADYVNQSQIQAMIEAMNNPPPHSAAIPPEESVPLPPPIVNYSMDEPKMAGLRKGTQQPNCYVEGGHNVQPSHMQRRQISDTNAGTGGMQVEHGPVGSQHGAWPRHSNTGRVGGRGGYGEVGDGRVGQQEGRQRNYFQGRSSPIGKVQRQHELPSQLSGPASLLSPSSSITPVQRQCSLDNKQRTQSDAQYQAMQEQQALRQSNNVLTPGITTEVHAVAQGLMDDHEGGEGREVTGVPYDPNLTCVLCGKVFRIGEIRLYRSHCETCVGIVE